MLPHWQRPVSFGFWIELMVVRFMEIDKLEDQILKVVFERGGTRYLYFYDFMP